MRFENWKLSEKLEKIAKLSRALFENWRDRWKLFEAHRLIDAAGRFRENWKNRGSLESHSEVGRGKQRKNRGIIRNYSRRECRRDGWRWAGIPRSFDRFSAAVRHGIIYGSWRSRKSNGGAEITRLSRRNWHDHGRCCLLKRACTHNRRASSSSSSLRAALVIKPVS